MLPVRVILHPTDFSESSGCAFRLACSLARDYGARLVVIHVMPTVAVAVPFVTIPAEPLDVREQLLEQLANVQSRDPNVAVEHHLKEGDPSTEILQYAQQIKCDLIVMGTHGRSGLGRLFLGSVAEQVLRKAPCAVLTVKTPVAASASSSDTLQESAIV
jgi:nucleotide-binding universal stress UspA family protein